MKNRAISILLSVILAISLLALGVSAKPGYEVYWSQGFESYATDDWYSSDMDEDGFGWVELVEDVEDPAYEGSTYLASYSYSNDLDAPLKPDNWLFGPDFEVRDGDLLTFAIQAVDETVPGDFLGVYLLPSTEGSNPILLTTCKTTAEWREISVDLSLYAGEYMSVAFRHYNCSDCFAVGLDAVTLWRRTGGAAKPQQNEKLGKHSDWADAELREAMELGLIPECLYGKDLSTNLTREEFAAVAVAYYEAFTGADISRVSENPFRDTANQDVLKAYSLGIVNGVGNGRFAPQQFLTREAASTMMDRAYYIAIGDDNPTVDVTEYFRDNDAISDWAWGHVYFMAQNNVLKGMGNGYFEPKIFTMREQGIIIALRALQNLG